MSCRRGDLDERVAIRALKDAAVRFGGQAEVRIPVASAARSRASPSPCIGSGPDGLTAAYYLARLGRHDVTMFEALAEPGGMLRYHPPDATGEARVRKASPMTEALDRDLGIIRDAGVTIRTHSPVHSIAELREQGYDAIFISATARTSYVPEVPARGPDDPVEPMTVVEGVFGGREEAFGPASAVEAIAHGREMARAIDIFLGGRGDIDEHLAPAEILSELPPLPVETGQRFRPSRKAGGATADHGYSIEDAREEASRCLRCDLEQPRASGTPRATRRPGAPGRRPNPKRPLMQRCPSVTDESVGEVTLTIRSSWTWRVSVQPTPQYGQIVSVRVWAASSQVPAARISCSERNISAPVGQTPMQLPQ